MPLIDDERTPPSTAGRRNPDANATRVGAGRALHAVATGRGAGVWQRRFAEIYRGLSERYGSMPEALKQMIRNAASLCIEAEKVQARQVAGEDVDAEQIKQLSDAVGRALERIAALAPPPEPPADPHDGPIATEILGTATPEQFDAIEMWSVAMDTPEMQELRDNRPRTYREMCARERPLVDGLIENAKKDGLENPTAADALIHAIYGVRPT